MIRDYEEDLLRTLTRKVKTISLARVAATLRWTGPSDDPLKAARRRIKSLVKRGYAELRTVSVQHLDVTGEPVFTYRAGLPLPDFGPIAWTVRSRWKSPPVLTEIVLATAKTRKLFGTRFNRLRSQEQAHDIALGDLWIKLQCTRPEVAAAWDPERPVGTSLQGKRPDVTIRGVPGLNAIEMCGSSYSKQHLTAFHAAITKNGPISYELH